VRNAQTVVPHVSERRDKQRGVLAQSLPKRRMGQRDIPSDKKKASRMKSNESIKKQKKKSPRKAPSLTRTAPTVRAKPAKSAREATRSEIVTVLTPKNSVDSTIKTADRIEGAVVERREKAESLVEGQPTTTSDLQQAQSPVIQLPSPVISEGGTDTASLRALVKRIQELERERDRLKNQLWKIRGRPSRLLAVLMLAVGAISLVSAAVYDVLVLAFTGLGLSFWGALLLQVRPSGYLKAELLDSTTVSSVMSTDHLLGELGYIGKGVYMRNGKQEAVVFIGATNDAEAPSPDSLRENTFLDSPKGVTVVPPGRSLANLLEREMGTEITMRNFEALRGRLRTVLIEDLEVAKEFEMNLEKGNVRCRFERSRYAGLCKALQDSTRICSTTGCPLCSAIACLLTAITGRPVTFEGESLSKGGSTMESSYRILALAQ
jgi:hypothetical protein